MPHLSLRVSEELLSELDAEADERDVSRSDYIRSTLGTRHEMHERVAELERELQQTEARVEDLRRQLQQANAGERDVDEIVAYVGEERLDRQRERERRNAPAWRRAKWWLFGRSD